METPTDPNIATCPTCGTLIDVSEQEPYAKIHCSSCGTWMRVRQSFANYEIQGILGEGGQGMVYRGVDKKLNRPVAIKLMKRQYSADPLFVKRFESEARVTAGLNHPNVVKVFSFGEDRGLLYLAMEMVDHGSLDALMSQIKKVPEDRVLEVGIQIAKGLQAGLEKGLIHRDIKPGNILFADAHTAKIVDFGLAVLVEKQHEEEGDVWATPYYVSPEKLDGKAEDFRSDMYSLAAALFHAIAGRPPFIAETNSMSELKKIKSKPTHLLSFAPHATTATAFVLDKALSVSPDDRFSTYEDFIHNLEYAQNELRKRPKNAPSRRLVKVAEESNSGVWITLVVLGLVIAAGLGYYFGHNQPKPVVQQPTPEATTPKTEDAETAFRKACEQLLKGKAKQAVASFRDLEKQKLNEPLKTWVTTHLGLAELMEGHVPPARAAFRVLGERLDGAHDLDEATAAFFSKLATLAGSESQPTADEVKNFDQKSYESIAFLVLGLKAWESGQYDQGAELLKTFKECNPAGDAAWVGDYRPLVNPYLREYVAFNAAKQSLTGYEKNIAGAAETLKDLESIRQKVTSTGLASQLTDIELEYGPKITAAMDKATTKNNERMAAQTAAEEQALMDAKLKMKGLCETYRFKEALTVMQAAKVSLPDTLKEKELLLRRVDWLVQFKDQLIRDLNTSGYSAVLQRRAGAPLAGGVARASDMQLDVKVQFGNLPIAWADLTPQSVLAMARSFMKPSLPPDALADREWQAGVFCIFTGLTNESEALMAEAATAKPDYRFDKGLFFGQSDEPAPAANTPAPAPEAPKQDVAPGNGTEMADKPLNPSKSDVNDNIIKGLRRPTQP